MKENEIKKYQDRLMGLMPPERIVKVDIPRYPKEVIRYFQEMEGATPAVADVLDSIGVKGTIPASILKPVVSGKKIVGPAITIRYIPEAYSPDYAYYNDERAKLADRDLYAIAEIGDIPVFDVGGLADVSVMGGLSAHIAKKWGMAGNIVDGGVRDIDVIKKLDYPVWSRGQTPKTGKFRVEAIEINGSISVADIRVNPGDLIIADDSGIVVIPHERVEEVIEKTKATAAKEQEIIHLIEKGASVKELSSILHPSKW